MKHVVSYGKLHIGIKTVQGVINSFYIFKMPDLLLMGGACSTNGGEDERA
jgi:hypothetical protein